MASFEDFVAARGLALTRFAYLLCGDAQLAEDLVQSALERTFQRWRRAGIVARPEAYVRQVIVHEYVSRQRRRSASEVVVADPPDVFVSDGGAAVDERDRVWRELATLPTQQRAVLVLRYYEDLDDVTIARLLGCARGTVRSAASRALATLRASSLPMERRDR